MNHAPIQVFKFGGTSVGNAEALRHALKHAQAAAPAVAVVVSAMSGVTDQLLQAAHAAAAGDLGRAESAAAAFRDRHLALLSDLLPPQERPALAAVIAGASEELHALCQAVSVLRELTPRTLDATVARGERVLARVFAAALRARDVPAEYVDATEIISLSRQAGGVWPDLPACAQAAAERLRPLLVAGVVPVVPGFIGRGPAGETVTLGRGGSDFSAAILGRSLQAARVVLYKEVDGLMTTDPRAVPEARLLPELHYREAAELAYYGAKVLHPRTLIPLIGPRIPLVLRNTFGEQGEGGPYTRVSAEAPEGAYPVKALSAVTGQALCAIEGNGMMGVPGIAGRAFSALSQAGHSVSMISQGSSEASICFVLPQAEAQSAAAALTACFADEIEAGLIERVRVQPGIALLSVVGLGMRGTPGIAARAFSALARERINILAIAQGSSELSITAAIIEGDVSAALRALHREFQLDRLRALGDAPPREATLTLLGFGQIGCALARQIAGQGAGPGPGPGGDDARLRTVALIDRSALLLREGGLDAQALLGLAQDKRAGVPLRAQPGALPLPPGQEALQKALKERLFCLPGRRPVLVDLTAEETAPLLLQALRSGCHVVLANKKPLCVPIAAYDELVATAAERGLMLRHEATVGAGLPVLDTLHKLREAGDEILDMQGCLSGTLGYLTTQMEDGVPFSQAVARAHALGYTEPDPRDDLSGMDVARKALILARAVGLRLDLADVAVEPLFPQNLSDPDPARFLAGLAGLDEARRAQVEAARQDGKVLRYVARISRQGVRVGLAAVPAASPMGRLRGTDNQIVLRTARYRENPLVVIGPGAGAEVTAAGVLNDIMAIARSA
jgi:aspartokinase/homoserine dehydrogenase 1